MISGKEKEKGGKDGILQFMLKEITTEVTQLSTGLKKAHQNINALEQLLAAEQRTIALLRHQTQQQGNNDVVDHKAFEKLELEVQRKNKRIRELELKSANDYVNEEQQRVIEELQRTVARQHRDLEQCRIQQDRWAEAAREDEAKMQMMHARLQQMPYVAAGSHLAPHRGEGPNITPAPPSHYGANWAHNNSSAPVPPSHGGNIQSAFYTMAPSVVGDHRARTPANGSQVKNCATPNNGKFEGRNGSNHLRGMTQANGNIEGRNGSNHLGGRTLKTNLAPHHSFGSDIPSALDSAPLKGVSNQHHQNPTPRSSVPGLTTAQQSTTTPPDSQRTERRMHTSGNSTREVTPRFTPPALGQEQERTTHHEGNLRSGNMNGSHPDKTSSAGSEERHGTTGNGMRKSGVNGSLSAPPTGSLAACAPPLRSQRGTTTTTNTSAANTFKKAK